MQSLGKACKDMHMCIRNPFSPGYRLSHNLLLFALLLAQTACFHSDERVAEGCLSLDRVQQRNLRVAPGNVYSFSLFRPREAETEPLVELLAEVRRVRNLGFENDDGLLTNASPADASNCQTIGSGSNIDGISSKLNHLNIACGSSNRCEQLDNSESAQPTEARDMGSGKCAPVTVDGREVERELMRCWLGRYITVNQLVPLQVHGLQLLVWVAATHTLPLEDREQTLGYHCFRGTLTPLTTVYLKQTDVAVLNQSGRPHNSEAQKSSRVQSHLTLVNTRQPPLPGESPHIIAVHTNDGEEFRVARTLLRPCISLTRALRDAETSALSIDVDTATFDRVLIFLEAEALGKARPVFAAHLLPDLWRAASVLALRSLQDDCQNRLGELESRVRVYSFDEVKQKNAAGECWLILDGMLLDVTRWLPEHPGGSTIIPNQALDLDCARFFEVYHASRESFLYLKQFYMGEIDPRDRDSVPCPAKPSEEFLQQLSEYTASFRMHLSEEPKAYKSF
eukprot:jgi/Botrbrau1/15487/Bobra.43_2s0107.2